MSGKINIRMLKTKDLPFALELTQIASWNQTKEDWSGFINYEPEGCFLLEYDNIPAATGVALNYQNKMGWIGMVLVHPRFRRRGLGKAIMNRALSYLGDLGIDCIKLDATPMGRNLYLAMGFKDEYKLERLEGVIRPSNNSLNRFLKVHKMKSDDIKKVADFDGEIFGVRREKIINGLFTRFPMYSYICKEHGEIKGCILCRKGANAYQIGPWIAKSFDMGKSLYNSLALELEGKNVFVDIISANDNVKGFLRESGFQGQREFTRMYKGNNKWISEAEIICSLSGPEKG